MGKLIPISGIIFGHNNNEFNDNNDTATGFPICCPWRGRDKHSTSHLPLSVDRMSLSQQRVALTSYFTSHRKLWRGHCCCSSAPRAPRRRTCSQSSGGCSRTSCPQQSSCFRRASFCSRSSCPQQSSCPQESSCDPNNEPALAPGVLPAPRSAPGVVPRPRVPTSCTRRRGTTGLFQDFVCARASLAVR